MARRAVRDDHHPKAIRRTCPEPFAALDIRHQLAKRHSPLPRSQPRCMPFRSSNSYRAAKLHTFAKRRKDDQDKEKGRLLREKTQRHLDLLQHSQVQLVGRLRQLWRLQALQRLLLDQRVRGIHQVAAQLPEKRPGRLRQVELELSRSVGDTLGRSHGVHSDARAGRVRVHIVDHIGWTRLDQLNYKHQLLRDSGPHHHLFVQEHQQANEETRHTVDFHARQDISTGVGHFRAALCQRYEHYHLRRLSQPVVNVTTPPRTHFTQRTSTI